MRFGAYRGTLAEKKHTVQKEKRLAKLLGRPFQINANVLFCMILSSIIIAPFHARALELLLQWEHDGEFHGGISVETHAQ